MNNNQLIVVDHESKYWVEVLNAAKLFDLERLKPIESRSSPKRRKNKRSRNSLNMQSKRVSRSRRSYSVRIKKPKVARSEASSSGKRTESGKSL